jgi:CMP-N,N'-diacetyllegionaminic acid synthase
MKFDDFLVIIPARKGSKGIPGKNKKKLNGKPLIEYTFDVALKLFDIENICVSTDDNDIQKLAEDKGIKVPFLRPENLSNDKSSAREVVLHEITLRKKDYKSIIYLQPTSPLRSETELLEAIKLYNESLDMVVSVVESKSNPYFNLFEENSDGNLRPIINSKIKNRQECPKVYKYNGAIYIININSLKKHELSEFKKIKKYIMNPSNSIDIDDELDWFLAEQLLKLKTE